MKAKKHVPVPAPEDLGQQMSMLFEEDEKLFLQPSDLLKCLGHTVCLDTETNGLNWWQHHIIGLGVYCPAAGLAGYIPALEEAERRAVCEAAQQLFADAGTTLILHNAKFDCHMLNVDMWSRKAKLFDTMVAAHLYDSRQPKSLRACEERWLGKQSKAALVKSRGKLMVWELPLASVAEYCINDCKVTHELAYKISPALRGMGLQRIMAEQMQYLGLIQKVERNGMLLNLEFVHRALDRFKKELAAMEEELYAKVGYKFEWTSGKMLSVALYEHMGIPMPINPFADEDGVDRTKFATRGKYNKTMTSTFLLMEKVNHPLAALVMDLRETTKLIEDLESWLELKDERNTLHPSYNPTGTRTYRLSCQKPNAQNVPSDVRARHTQSVYSGGAVREEEYNLRLAIVARPGYKIVSIDWKQQEMRLFAVLAQEPTMMQALRDRLDIHAEIAKQVWAKDIAEDPSCLKTRREWSKTVGFGLLYGGTVGSMQHRLNKTAEEADRIANDYWERFPRIMPFMREAVRKCSKDGYLRYWSGNVWREDDEGSMYKGVNALVQGGAAMLLSVASMRAQQYLDKAGDGEIIGFIHDELLFQLPADRAEQMTKELVPIMEVTDIFDVPFTVDTKSGMAWGDLK